MPLRFRSAEDQNKLANSGNACCRNCKSVSQSEIAEAAAQWASWPSYKFTTAVDELQHSENGGCEPPS